MTCLTNPISQPSVDISPIWGAMRFLTHREDLYDVIDSSWVQEIRVQGAHMTCLTNPISQPNVDISPIWRAMRFLTHREDLYDVIDSSWVTIRFQS
jgi:hypothetical protein